MEDKELLETNKHIPTVDVYFDIRDTQREIREYEAKKILQPKLSISYESEIQSRKRFIDTLELLIKLRKEQEADKK